MGVTEGLGVRPVTLFFCEGSDCIKPLFLQKDPEKKGNYKELLLLLDPDIDEDDEPSAARRCRCSASRLG